MSAASLVQQFEVQQFNTRCADRGVSLKSFLHLLSVRARLLTLSTIVSGLQARYAAKEFNFLRYVALTYGQPL